MKKDAVYTVIQHPLYSHFGQKKTREEAERRLGLKKGKKNLLFFGLIRSYKGLDILLEAFGMLPDDYQLIIAGEPYGSFDRYQQIIDSLPGKDRIFTDLRYIKDSEVTDYFSAADLAVLPYRSATQSGISSVSYHFEVPMVVTDVGGNPELVHTGAVCGLTVPYGDEAAYAAAIARLLEDDALRQQYAAAARAKASAEFDLYRLLDELFEIYQ